MRMVKKHTVAALAGTALALVWVAASGAADEGHGQVGERREPELHASQLASLRGATAPFNRLDVALAEGYTAFGGCFADPSGAGGMGYHYVNDALVADPAVDPLRLELLVYAPGPDGRLRLAAVEWITFVGAWHNAGNGTPPSLFGQEFHINPTLLSEPFYLLHAWIWRHNPSGMFANWNPRVSCP